ARGGLAAAAAFLERSAELTVEPARRGERLLAAARAKRDAGAFEAALALLVTLETEQLDSYSTAEAEHLRGQIALEQQQGGDAAAPLLIRALELRLAQDMGADEVGRSLWLAASRATQVIAPELWDADAIHTLATRQLEVAREAGALVQLRLALNFLGGSLIFSGELAR